MTVDPRPVPVLAKTCVNSSLIEAFFGLMWFGWGQQSPPGWLVPVLAVGSLGCVAVVVVAVLTFRRLRDVPSPLADRGSGRQYVLLVVSEFGLIGAGATLLGLTGHPDLIAGWACVVVGAHFFPLARVFPGIGMPGLGSAVVIVGLAAVAGATWSDVDSSTIAGPGAGLCLLVHGVLVLRRGRRLLVG